jgi:hypothetical protein
MAGYVGNCQKLHNGTQSCDGVASCEEKNSPDIWKKGGACHKCTDPLCEQQAQRFKANVTGDRVQMNPNQFNDTDDVELLLVNGQHKPTLDITAGTWVRLRLGFMAMDSIL